MKIASSLTSTVFLVEVSTNHDSTDLSDFLPPVTI